LRLPRFDYLEPHTLEEALEMRSEAGEKGEVLAGGTDLLVRMKQRLKRPSFLITLKHLRELEGVKMEEGELAIGAKTSLRDVIRSPWVQRYANGLAEALSSVGAYTIQHVRGTLGGNLCQDTRCLYYNQSAFWRSGRAPCHKAGGKICYAREGSDRCRSTNQSDGATALLALDARVTLRSLRGERSIPVSDLFTMKGEAPLDIRSDEILTTIRIPIASQSAASAYERISYRSAIDFPVACAAVLIEAEDKTIKRARIAVGAMGDAPLLMIQAAELLQGKPLEDEGVRKRAARVAMDHASAFAVNNVGATVEWRVSMVEVLVRRALRRACEAARGIGEGP
jgi:4-hydroxybenzoyl-CoA reductase subunit beta